MEPLIKKFIKMIVAISKLKLEDREVAQLSMFDCNKNKSPLLQFIYDKFKNHRIDNNPIMSLGPNIEMDVFIKDHRYRIYLNDIKITIDKSKIINI